jgi:MFS family permease
VFSGVAANELFPSSSTLLNITQAIGMLLLIFAPSLGWLVVYVLLYGAAYGAISPLRAAVMVAHMGRRAYGSILAWQGIPVALKFW